MDKKEYSTVVSIYKVKLAGDAKWQKAALIKLLELSYEKQAKKLDNHQGFSMVDMSSIGLLAVGCKYENSDLTEFQSEFVGKKLPNYAAQLVQHSDKAKLTAIVAALQ